MRIANCRYRAELSFQRCTERAQADYEHCKASGEYCFEEYCDEETCNGDGDGQCDDPYQRCYSICGGQVTSETRCVANCEGK